MPPNKLTIHQEREIVRRAASGETQRSLAKFYEVQQTTIYRCMKKYKSQLNGGIPAYFFPGGSAMESAASFCEQNSHSQGAFRNKITPVVLSAEQEFEAAGRLFAFTESDQELASYYGVNVSEIRRIKERPRSAENFAQCFEAAARYHEQKTSRPAAGAGDGRITHPAADRRYLRAEGGLSNPEPPDRGRAAEVPIAAHRPFAEVPPFASSHAMPANIVQQPASPTAREVLRREDMDISVLNQDLRDRVEQRIKRKPQDSHLVAEDAKQNFFGRLIEIGLHSIGECRFLHGESGLGAYGFDESEVDLLLLSDSEWEEKHGWLQLFFKSLPECFQNQGTLSRTRIAVRSAGISNQLELLSSVETLGLPVPLEVYLRREAINLGAADHDAVSIFSQVSGEEMCDQCPDGHDMDNSLDAAAREDGADSGRVDEVCEQVNSFSLSASDQSALPELPCSSLPGLASASHKLSHNTAETAVLESSDCRHQTQGSQVYSPDRTDPLSNANAAGCSTECNSGSDQQMSTFAAVSAVSERNQDEVFSTNQEDIAQLSKLQNHVSRINIDLFPGTDGISGSLRPTSQVNVLAKAFESLQAERCDKQFDFLDLGCSVGHALICAAFSGWYVHIYGVDLPDNKQSITNIFSSFLSKASQHTELKVYETRFRQIQFFWANAGDESKNNIKDLLTGVELARPMMIYWYSVGWHREHIKNAGKILSNSPLVHCIAVVARDQGKDACRLQTSLNVNSYHNPFRLTHTVRKCLMTGSGSFTTYIFTRKQEFEYKIATAASPLPGQRVQVIFQDKKWYSGSVVCFNNDHQSGEILFDDDGTRLTFKHEDPDVFLLPTAYNQWKRHSDPESLKKNIPPNSFCFFCCNDFGDGANGDTCSRCNLSVYHRKCYEGLDASTGSDYICFICRGELADLGRSQEPLYKLKVKKTSNIICYGCGSILSVAQTSRAQERRIKCYNLCRFCNHSFGICCTARPMDIIEPYSCPACLGIACHDADLECIVSEMSGKLEKIISNVNDNVTAKIENSMDACLQAVSSLQMSCQWELLAKVLPVAVKSQQYQVTRRMEPSMSPFDTMNLLAMKDGPDLALFREVSRLFVQHAKLRATSAGQGKICTGPLPRSLAFHGFDKDTRLKIGILTSDMRLTPWWSLKKVVLIEIAQQVDLFIFSRPPCSLSDDPYYAELARVSTIVDFEDQTEDYIVADDIQRRDLHILVDEGGPTDPCNVGVLTLRPCPLQVSHLGYPGDQPGGHIDFTITDQYAMDPDGAQGIGAEERLMFLNCYQPNSAFKPTVSIPNSRTVEQTIRADWALPNDAFVFAIFCRLGRMDSELAKSLITILKRTPKSVLWLRKHPSFAVLRLLRFFRKNDIPRNRIILAEDVPPDVHEERLRHVDLALDTRLYGAHTTCSDFLRQGTPFLCLVGEWFHLRVSYSLVQNLMENDALIAMNLPEFERKAVEFYERPDLLGSHREVIKEALKSNTRIFDGHNWVAAFVRGLREMIRQRCSNEEARDIFTVPRIRTAGSSARLFVSVLDVTPLEVQQSQMRCPDADSQVWLPLNCSTLPLGARLISRGEKRCASTVQPPRAARLQQNRQSVSTEHVKSSQALCESNADSCVSVGSNVSAEFKAAEQHHQVQKGACDCRQHCSVSKLCHNVEGDRMRKTRASEFRLEWLFDLTKTDRNQARSAAYNYIKRKCPDLASKICTVQNSEGTEIPFIQLPCLVPRISPNTGNTVGYDELPLMFVANGIHGKHLYVGQAFCRGMTFTLYDGILLQSDQVNQNNKSWVRSLQYQHLAIDGRGHGEFPQLENSSLGHLANHSSKSVAFYKHRNVRASVSGALESIFLVARQAGEAFTEVTAFYTNGSAQRHHGIAMHRIEAGEDHMQVASSGFPDPVVNAAEKLRTSLGWDLIRTCGSGSFGSVIEVRSGSRKFAVKIGNKRYDKCSRLDLLGEAAILRFANIKQDSTAGVGIFSLKLVTDCGLDSGGAALVGPQHDRVSILAMELADSSARGLWKDMSERYRAGNGDVGLLHDLKSVISGTVKVVRWMHECELAHGDMKPDNMLLKQLPGAPSDSRVAYCVVRDAYYQIFLSDWGSARWSGRGIAAIHVYSTEGKAASSTRIDDLAGSSCDVAPVGARELQIALGLSAQSALVLRHPGFCTAWVRAPHCDRDFPQGCGMEQRRFDQAGDVWALGAISARLLCELYTRTDMQKLEKWTDTLHQASRRAENLILSGSQVEERAMKVARISKSKVVKRAIEANSMHGQGTGKSSESWIESMVQQHFPDAWNHLSSCISGPNGAEWKSLLDLVQGLLRYNSEHRLTAMQAQQHPCIYLPPAQGK